MTRTLLFDLDGTLSDPALGIGRCIRHALDRLGAPAPDDAALRRWIGPPLLDSFAAHLGEREAAETAVALYRERFAEIGLFENALYPGTLPMLEALRARGARMILATSKPRVYAARILDHFALEPFFAAVHGAELDGTRADKADLLPWIVAREAVDPARAAMIGDRSHDMIGARAARLRPVGALWGFGDREELLHAGADLLVAAPEDLAAALGAA